MQYYAFSLDNSWKLISERLKLYLPLIKHLQTGLLVITGFTGYASAKPAEMSFFIISGLLGSLFLTISGSTVLNMVWDRDIDSRMNRTTNRPLPAGRLHSIEASILGVTLSVIGMAWAFSLSLFFAVVLFSGLFLDVIVYTIWLKRKTAWSIVWGGVSGGMPILAGRVLGLGEIDWIGIVLCLAILLWIPTHILTFSMRFYDDYSRARIPTFPSTYGYNNTRRVIALSSLGAAMAMGTGAWALGIAMGYLQVLVLLSVGILALGILSVYHPSERINFSLFKYASLYMLGSMVLVVFGVLR